MKIALLLAVLVACSNSSAAPADDRDDAAPPIAPIDAPVAVLGKIVSMPGVMATPMDYGSVGYPPGGGIYSTGLTLVRMGIPTSPGTRLRSAIVGHWGPGPCTPPNPCIPGMGPRVSVVVQHGRSNTVLAELVCPRSSDDVYQECLIDFPDRTLASEETAMVQIWMEASNIVSHVSVAID